MKTILCITSSIRHASQIVECLREEGFSSEDISAVFPEAVQSLGLPHRQVARYPVGAGQGAFGWLTRTGARTVSGPRTLVATGYLAVCDHAAPGERIENLVEALCSLGVPEAEARVYEDKLKNGGVLVCCHTEDYGEIVRARDIFEGARAQNIAAATVRRFATEGEEATSNHAVAEMR